MRLTETVKQLLILNILFFIGATFTPIARDFFSLYFPLNPKFEYWQIITHMFMHGDFLHLFFNMFALISFGSALEHFWGWKKFLFFYISCGLGAALLHTGINYYEYQHSLKILLDNGFNQNEIIELIKQREYDMRWEDYLSINEIQSMEASYNIRAVGASGAIYGLLVAFAFMFPNAELMLLFIPFPIKAKYFVPGLVFIDLVLGLKGDSLFGGSSGIAHFAHVGGALFGFIMMWYWKNNQFNKNRWD